MAIIAFLDNHGNLLLTEITPAVLNTARIDIVCEALATCILLTISKVE